ncbi:glycosyltransferase [Bacteroides thetaiotaomicron]|nr:glycosyltransferase [Bacteroides thetaiotaomicron]
MNEGRSNAIVEAIACGLPIISSNLPFNDDILDSSNALLVNPESVDDIASAIKQLMDNSDLRQKLAEGSKEKAKSLRIEFRAKKIIEFINRQMQK